MDKTEAQADRAEALVQDFDAQIAQLEADEERTTGELATAIAGGVSGKPIRELSDARDLLQLKLGARRRDRATAATAAQAARATADAARFGAAVNAIDVETRASDAVLEELLTRLAAAWAARSAIVARATALQKELLIAQRRHRVTIAGPAESALTSDLLVLCAEAGPALRVLADEREAAAHPAPPPLSDAYPFFIAGDGERARAQRVRMAELKTERANAGHRRA